MTTSEIPGKVQALTTVPGQEVALTFHLAKQFAINAIGPELKRSGVDKSMPMGERYNGNPKTSAHAKMVR
ncbi:MAG: hypothetical protein ABL949_17015 [Fimbriimonadaceae bacterium]